MRALIAIATLAVGAACEKKQRAETRPARDAAITTPAPDAARPTPDAAPLDAAPPDAAAPSRYGDAAVVAFDVKGAVFYAADDVALREVGRVPFEIPEDPTTGEAHVWHAIWASREALYVRAGARAVFRVSLDAATPIAVPDRTTLTKVKLPYNYDELAVENGNAWFGACDDRAMIDAEEPCCCDRYRWLQIDPPGGSPTTGGDRPDPQFDWPTATPPGFSVTVDDEAAELTCAGPGSKITLTPGDESTAIIEHHWVSIDPPALVVMYGSEGMMGLSPDRWELRDGCKKVLDEGTYGIEPGPDGLWLGAKKYGARGVVYHGAQRLGDVRADRVYFRPPS